MPWHAMFICPRCGDRIASPPIDQDAKLEFFAILVKTTRPDSVYACPTCGDAPLNPEDRKRALFSGVGGAARERTVS